jgi:CheY-like chemotaxis protein
MEGSNMSRLDGCHVLLVDDDPDTLDMYRFVLAQGGAHLQTARTADEALAVLATSRVDVLVTDLTLPDESGLTLLRRVRAAGYTQPALAVTAAARRDVLKGALAAGFLDCLAKPLPPQDLVAAAQSACGAGQALGGAPPA